MNSNSNTYIFIYSVVMVVIVAAILSITATVLKDKQDLNIQNEKMSGILASAHIASTPENVVEMYSKHIVKELAIDGEGNIAGTYENNQLAGNLRAFDINLKVEQFNQSNGKPYFSPLFVCNKEGEIFYIIPMLGKGLWGPIWGNIALKADFRTIEGVIFDHKGETPGLGAEINTEMFQQQFVGKTIFDENGNFVSVKVQKGGAATLPANMQNHAVDAISGGTITSVGVDAMMSDCLSNYVAFSKIPR